MPALQNLVGRFFFVCWFLVPSLVHSWTACPVAIGYNAIKNGRISTMAPSTLSMSNGSNSNSTPSSSDESDESNDDKGLEEKILRKNRIAEAQAKIDRILNHPTDPAFDLESEIKKVTSITPPLIKEGSAEFQLEEQVSREEEELYKAVKAKDYVTAGKKSTEISNMHVDDCGLVLQANSNFYRAFSNKDIDEMGRIWLNDRSCICIHPSFKPLSGIPSIMKTWKRMFESSTGSFKRTWIDPCEIQLTVKATTAVVTCVEDVYTRRFVRGKRRKSELVNKLTATNIFRKVGGRWYMTYHHSSWHADSEAAKRALEHRMNAQESLAKRNGPSDSFGQNLANLRKSRRRSDDNDQDDDDNGDGGFSELESILGIKDFGPDMGTSSESKSQEDMGGPRIISSSLDFLKDLGGSPFGDIDSLLSQNGDDGGSMDGSSMGFPPGSIIRIAKINKNTDENSKDNNEDNEDEVDDYDEDDDEFIFENDDYDEEESNKGKGELIDLLGAVKKKNEKRKQEKLQKRPLRQKCIDALRKLSSDGRISQKQKRVLLTDIISCSAKGEESLVVHAYKLLCLNPTDEEAAEEDFVDQCQVFAESYF